MDEFMTHTLYLVHLTSYHAVIFQSTMLNRLYTPHPIGMILSKFMHTSILRLLKIQWQTELLLYKQWLHQRLRCIKLYYITVCKKVGICWQFVILGSSLSKAWHSLYRVRNLLLYKKACLLVCLLISNEY